MTLPEVAPAVTANKPSKQESKKPSQANYQIKLKDAEEGKVVTRFPPEPSGYLHIGHAKAALLNDFFAKMYKGTLLVRFDDTNPSKEKQEFEQSILEDLELMDIKPDKISFSSDYFDLMYDYALKMISEGKAYADDTDVETMRNERFNGIASKRRDEPVESSLERFELMKQGTEEGQRWCIRAKLSVDAKNKALRDPVIYRVNLEPHHRTGTKWKIYPTYDFCCPILDSIEGVTHALRTTEYNDREPQYQWMLKAMGLRKVHVWEFSRLNFIRTMLSKRKLQRVVDLGIVSGWDDPRMPTIRGIRRRGMTVEGLRQYIISQGPSKNILNQDWTTIWATNKKIIDPIAPRHTAICATNVVKVTLSGAPTEVVYEMKPKHKKNPDVGLKKVAYYNKILLEQEDCASLDDNEEVTLMDWGNAIVTQINKEDGIIKSVEMKLHLEGDFKKTKKKLTWLADTPDKKYVRMTTFDSLISKDKFEEQDELEDIVNKDSAHSEFMFADLNTEEFAQGDFLQFERKGYVICDQPFVKGKKYSDGAEIVFFDIPDGKTVNRYGAKPTEANKQESKPTLGESDTITNDLKLNQNWSDIQPFSLTIEGNKFEMIKGINSPQKELKFVFPCPSDQALTMKFLSQLFKSLEDFSKSNKFTEKAPTTILLAIVSKDSTILYYNISNGLVAPQ